MAPAPLVVTECSWSRPADVRVANLFGLGDAAAPVQLVGSKHASRELQEACAEEAQLEERLAELRTERQLLSEGDDSSNEDAIEALERQIEDVSCAKERAGDDVARLVTEARSHSVSAAVCENTGVAPAPLVVTEFSWSRPADLPASTPTDAVSPAAPVQLVGSEHASRELQEACAEEAQLEERLAELRTERQLLSEGDDSSNEDAIEALERQIEDVSCAKERAGDDVARLVTEARSHSVSAAVCENTGVAPAPLVVTECSWSRPADLPASTPTDAVSPAAPVQLVGSEHASRELQEACAEEAQLEERLAELRTERQLLSEGDDSSNEDAIEALERQIEDVSCAKERAGDDVARLVTEARSHSVSAAVCENTGVAPAPLVVTECSWSRPADVRVANLFGLGDAAAPVQLVGSEHASRELQEACAEEAQLEERLAELRTERQLLSEGDDSSNEDAIEALERQIEDVSCAKERAGDDVDVARLVTEARSHSVSAAVCENTGVAPAPLVVTECSWSRPADLPASTPTDAVSPAAPVQLVGSEHASRELQEACAEEAQLEERLAELRTERQLLSEGDDSSNKDAIEALERQIEDVSCAKERAGDDVARLVTEARSHSVSAAVCENTGVAPAPLVVTECSWSRPADLPASTPTDAVSPAAPVQLVGSEHASRELQEACAEEAQLEERLAELRTERQLLSEGDDSSNEDAIEALERQIEDVSCAKERAGDDVARLVTEARSHSVSAAVCENTGVAPAPLVVTECSWSRPADVRVANLFGLGDAAAPVQLVGSEHASRELQEACAEEAQLEERLAELRTERQLLSEGDDSSNEDAIEALERQIEDVSCAKERAGDDVARLVTEARSHSVSAAVCENTGVAPAPLVVTECSWSRPADLPASTPTDAVSPAAPVQLVGSEHASRELQEACAEEAQLEERLAELRTERQLLSEGDDSSNKDAIEALERQIEDVSCAKERAGDDVARLVTEARSHSVSAAVCENTGVAPAPLVVTECSWSRPADLPASTPTDAVSPAAPVQLVGSEHASRELQEACAEEAQLEERLAELRTERQLLSEGDDSSNEDAIEALERQIEDVSCAKERAGDDVARLVTEARSHSVSAAVCENTGVAPAPLVVTECSWSRPADLPASTPTDAVSPAAPVQLVGSEHASRELQEACAEEAQLEERLAELRTERQLLSEGDDSSNKDAIEALERQIEDVSCAKERAGDDVARLVTEARSHSVSAAVCENTGVAPAPLVVTECSWSRPADVRVANLFGLGDAAAPVQLVGSEHASRELQEACAEEAQLEERLAELRTERQLLSEGDDSSNEDAIEALERQIEDVSCANERAAEQIDTPVKHTAAVCVAETHAVASVSGAPATPLFAVEWSWCRHEEQPLVWDDTEDESETHTISAPVIVERSLALREQSWSHVMPACRVQNVAAGAPAGQWAALAEASWEHAVPRCAVDASIGRSPVVLGVVECAWSRPREAGTAAHGETQALQRAKIVAEELEAHLAALGAERQRLFDDDDSSDASALQQLDRQIAETAVEKENAVIELWRLQVECNERARGVSAGPAPSETPPVESGKTSPSCGAAVVAVNRTRSRADALRDVTARRERSTDVELFEVAWSHSVARQSILFHAVAGDSGLRLSAAQKLVEAARCNLSQAQARAGVDGSSQEPRDGDGPPGEEPAPRARSVSVLAAKEILAAAEAACQSAARAPSTPDPLSLTPGSATSDKGAGLALEKRSIDPCDNDNDNGGDGGGSRGNLSRSATDSTPAHPALAEIAEQQQLLLALAEVQAAASLHTAAPSPRAASDCAASLQDALARQKALIEKILDKSQQDTGSQDPVAETAPGASPDSLLWDDFATQQREIETLLGAHIAASDATPGAKPTRPSRTALATSLFETAWSHSIPEARSQLRSAKVVPEDDVSPPDSVPDSPRERGRTVFEHSDIADSSLPARFDMTSVSIADIMDAFRNPHVGVQTDTPDEQSVTANDCSKELQEACAEEAQLEERLAELRTERQLLSEADDSSNEDAIEALERQIEDVSCAKERAVAQIAVLENKARATAHDSPLAAGQVTAATTLFGVEWSWTREVEVPFVWDDTEDETHEQSPSATEPRIIALHTESWSHCMTRDVDVPHVAEAAPATDPEHRVSKELQEACAEEAQLEERLAELRTERQLLSEADDSSNEDAIEALERQIEDVSRVRERAGADVLRLQALEEVGVRAQLAETSWEHAVPRCAVDASVGRSPVVLGVVECAWSRPREAGTAAHGETQALQRARIVAEELEAHLAALGAERQRLFDDDDSSDASALQQLDRQIAETAVENALCLQILDRDSTAPRAETTESLFGVEWSWTREVEVPFVWDDTEDESETHEQSPSATEPRIIALHTESWSHCMTRDVDVPHVAEAAPATDPEHRVSKELQEACAEEAQLEERLAELRTERQLLSEGDDSSNEDAIEALERQIEDVSCAKERAVAQIAVLEIKETATARDSPLAPGHVAAAATTLFGVEWSWTREVEVPFVWDDTEDEESGEELALVSPEYPVSVPVSAAPPASPAATFDLFETAWAHSVPAVTSRGSVAEANPWHVPSLFETAWSHSIPEARSQLRSAKVVPEDDVSPPDSVPDSPRERGRTVFEHSDIADSSLPARFDMTSVSIADIMDAFRNPHVGVQTDTPDEQSVTANDCSKELQEACAEEAQLEERLAELRTERQLLSEADDSSNEDAIEALERQIEDVSCAKERAVAQIAVLENKARATAHDSPLAAGQVTAATTLFGVEWSWTREVEVPFVWDDTEDETHEQSPSATEPRIIALHTESWSHCMTRDVDVPHVAEAAPATDPEHRVSKELQEACAEEAQLEERLAELRTERQLLSEADDSSNEDAIEALERQIEDVSCAKERAVAQIEALENKGSVASLYSTPLPVRPRAVTAATLFGVECSWTREVEVPFVWDDTEDESDGASGAAAGAVPPSTLSGLSWSHHMLIEMPSDVCRGVVLSARETSWRRCEEPRWKLSLDTGSDSSTDASSLPRFSPPGSARASLNLTDGDEKAKGLFACSSVATMLPLSTNASPHSRSVDTPVEGSPPAAERAPAWSQSPPGAQWPAAAAAAKHVVLRAATWSSCVPASAAAQETDASSLCETVSVDTGDVATPCAARVHASVQTEDDTLPQRRPRGASLAARRDGSPYALHAAGTFLDAPSATDQRRRSQTISGGGRALSATASAPCGPIRLSSAGGSGGGSLESAEVATPASPVQSSRSSRGSRGEDDAEATSEDEGTEGSVCMACGLSLGRRAVCPATGMPHGTAASSSASVDEDGVNDGITDDIDRDGDTDSCPLPECEIDLQVVPPTPFDAALLPPQGAAGGGDPTMLSREWDAILPPQTLRLPLRSAQPGERSPPASSPVCEQCLAVQEALDTAGAQIETLWEAYKNFAEGVGREDEMAASLSHHAVAPSSFASASTAVHVHDANAAPTSQASDADSCEATPFRPREDTSVNTEAEPRRRQAPQPPLHDDDPLAEAEAEAPPCPAAAVEELRPDGAAAAAAAAAQRQERESHSLAEECRDLRAQLAAHEERRRVELSADASVPPPPPPPPTTTTTHDVGVATDTAGEEDGDGTASSQPLAAQLAAKAAALEGAVQEMAALEEGCAELQARVDGLETAAAAATDGAAVVLFEVSAEMAVTREFAAGAAASVARPRTHTIAKRYEDVNRKLADKQRELDEMLQAFDEAELMVYNAVSQAQHRVSTVEAENATLRQAIRAANKRESGDVLPRICLEEFDTMKLRRQNTELRQLAERLESENDSLCGSVLAAAGRNPPPLPAAGGGGAAAADQKSSRCLAQELDSLARELLERQRKKQRRRERINAGLELDESMYSQSMASMASMSLEGTDLRALLGDVAARAAKPAAASASSQTDATHCVTRHRWEIVEAAVQEAVEILTDARANIRVIAELIPEDLQIEATAVHDGIANALKTLALVDLRGDGDGSESQEGADVSSSSLRSMGRRPVMSARERTAAWKRRLGVVAELAPRYESEADTHSVASSGASSHSRYSRSGGAY